DDAEGPKVLEGHTALVRGVALASGPAPEMILSASSDFTLRRWRLGDTGWREDVPPGRGHAGPVLAVAFASPGLFLSAGADGTIRLWDAATGAALEPGIAASPPGEGFQAAAFSRDGRFVATATANGELLLRRVAATEKPRTLAR